MLASPSAEERISDMAFSVAALHAWSRLMAELKLAPPDRFFQKTSEGLFCKIQLQVGYNRII